MSNSQAAIIFPASRPMLDQADFLSNPMRLIQCVIRSAPNRDIGSEAPTKHLVKPFQLFNRGLSSSHSNSVGRSATTGITRCCSSGPGTMAATWVKEASAACAPRPDAPRSRADVLRPATRSVDDGIDEQLREVRWHFVPATITVYGAHVVIQSRWPWLRWHCAQPI